MAIVITFIFLNGTLMGGETGRHDGRPHLDE